jgi:protein tyrosine/serine phosphatase
MGSQSEAFRFTKLLHTPGGRARAWANSLLVDHAVLRLAWSNFAVVVPGRLYRCNHPTPGRLAAMTRRLGLKSVVNLRGVTGSGSDALSREAAARLGLDFIDAPLKSRFAPPRERVLALAEAFRTMREPALVHCKSGADRAGFAAAIFLLMHGESAASAARQLTLRHGHLAGAESGVLGAFLRAYAREAEGRKPFAAWLEQDYDPARVDRDFRPHAWARFVNTRLLRRE